MSLVPHKKSWLRFVVPPALIIFFLMLIPQVQKRASWHEQMFSNLLLPFQWTVTTIGGGTTSLWRGYVMLVHAQEDNERLTAENAKLTGATIAAEETRLENERLRALLNFSEAYTMPSVVARVIANDARAEFKSFIVNRGSDDGIALYMPVVGPKGLVGRVGRVTGSSAQVLQLNDPNCAVDAMIQRSRARGVLVGAAAHADFTRGAYITRLEYLRRASDVQNDDVVVTSGLDQMFPQGIPIGTVHNVSTSQYGIFQDAEVAPFENFQELQEVMVLLYAPSREQ